MEMLIRYRCPVDMEKYISSCSEQTFHEEIQAVIEAVTLLASDETQ